MTARPDALDRVDLGDGRDVVVLLVVALLVAGALLALAISAGWLR